MSVLSLCSSLWSEKSYRFKSPLEATMKACWRHGVLFCNSFLIFGGYYFLQIPISLQNEIMNSNYSYTVSNHSGNLVSCSVCLGLGEVRYNVLFSIARWISVVICLPCGFLIDRLGNSRSAILFSIVTLLGSVLFTVGAMTRPATTPSYVLMVAGYACLSVGDGPLRFVQARVVAHCFPDATFSALAISSFGYCGEGLSFYVTPTIATTFGFIPSICLGVAACGFGSACSVGLAFLLQQQTPQVAVDYQKNKIMTLEDFRALPSSYWLWIVAVSFFTSSWIPKHANLPDYLQLRHGYTMEEASFITGLSPLVFFLSPFVSLVLKRVECDGIVTTFFIAWMVPINALLGFCPAVSVIVLVLVDGIAMVIVSVMLWQLIVVLCPASHVGTLSGLLFLLRTSSIALSLVATGYILNRHEEFNVESALNHYQDWFLMLITLSSAGLICGIVMNALDIRKANALNVRIGRWRQPNTEAIKLMSSMEPCSQYCGINGENNNTVIDDDHH